MKCDKCGKPSKDLIPVLTTGANGFRRYKLCQKCRGEKTVKESKPANEIKS